jgi:kynurenine formamidase
VTDPADQHPDPAYDEVRRLGKELSNWGRWGADDEIGTLNLVDAAAIQRGAACVRDGAGFTLALPLGEGGPHTNEIPGRFNPHHYMTAIGMSVPASPFFHFSDDVVVLPLNAATQWDSLAHVHYEGLLYNGVPAGEALSVTGAARNGIDKQARHPFATRGVLVDVARSRGVDRLAPDVAIGPDEVDAILGSTGTAVHPGDVLLVRTGHMRTFLVDGDRVALNGPAPGLGLAMAPWLRAHDVAAVASDNVMVEITPSEDGSTICPLHLVTIRDMGLLLGEFFVLDDLADACAAAGRWEFQFVAPPLPFTGGISSPLNPLALL